MFFKVFTLKNIKKHWVSYIHLEKYRKTIGFLTFFQGYHLEKDRKNHWFSYIFSRLSPWKISKNIGFLTFFQGYHLEKYRKTIGFLMFFNVFTLKKIGKPLVLLCFSRFSPWKISKKPLVFLHFFKVITLKNWSKVFPEKGTLTRTSAALQCGWWCCRPGWCSIWSAGQVFFSKGDALVADDFLMTNQPCKQHSLDGWLVPDRFTAVAAQTAKKTMGWVSRNITTCQKFIQFKLYHKPLQ